ncbi:unnamed protein product [Musa textilis]
MEALEIRIDNRLQETLSEFKRSLLENFGQLQQGGNSNSMLNRSGDTGRVHREYDSGYPRIMVEFPKWEDGDPTSWISRAEKFFRFHRTPEESKVEITSIQLDGDVI